MMLSIDPTATQAILIGASEFERDDKLPPLPAVKNNIRELQRLLAAPEIIGIQDDNITPIINPLSSDTDILPQLTDTVSKARDTLIIYYAGHGVISDDRKLYLATKNTVRSKPEFSGALSFSKIRDIATHRETTARKIIVILDCCYSGRAIEEFQPKGHKPVYILTATSSTEAAEAPEDAIYTAFTGELVFLLEKGIDNGKKIMTLGEIREYLKNQLVAKKFPEPKQVSYDDSHQLIFAHNRAYHDQYDIFVSYAGADNKPPEGAEKGRVTMLIEGLKNLLGQRLEGANAYTLRMDEELRGNEPVSLHVAQQLENSALFLLILSPNYIESSWCRWELSTFLAKIGKDLGRVFIVERHFERHLVKLPEELSGLSSYFLDDDLDYQKLEDLARQLSNKIKSFSTVTIEDSSLATVFLAVVSEDLEKHRDEVKRYLEQRNVQVLPNQNYHFFANNNQERLKQELNQCRFFIQLLSEKSDHGLPQFQYEHAQAANLHIFQWRDKGLNVKDVHNQDHKALLSQSTVTASSLLNFQEFIIAELKPKEEIKKEQIQSESFEIQSEPFVFINAAQEDMSLAHQIKKILMAHDVDCNLPLIAENLKPTDIQKDLEQQLLGCEAVLVLYNTNTPKVWVKEQIRYGQRMQGLRKKIYKVFAVCDKREQQSLSIHISNLRVQILRCPTLQTHNGLPLFIKMLEI
jgi:hypothetical protein